MRISEVARETKETVVRLGFNLDGKGKAAIDTGVGFLDHMLELFALHGGCDLDVKCDGDLKVDSHHTVEDVGICLGKAIAEALGDKKGVVRYGSILLPMDDALIAVAVDLGGRSYLNCDVAFPAPKIGTFDTELIEEFFTALIRESGINLHFVRMAGKNGHHIAEAMFKGFGRALRQAAAIDYKNADLTPSTKGTL